MELNYVTVTLCIRAYRLNSIKLRYTKASCLSRQVSAKPRTSDLYMTPPAAARALTAERQLLSTRQTDGGRTETSKSTVAIGLYTTKYIQVMTGYIKQIAQIRSMATDDARFVVSVTCVLITPVRSAKAD